MLYIYIYLISVFLNCLNRIRYLNYYFNNDINYYKQTNTFTYARLIDSTHSSGIMTLNSDDDIFFAYMSDEDIIEFNRCRLYTDYWIRIFMNKINIINNGINELREKAIIISEKLDIHNNKIDTIIENNNINKTNINKTTINVSKYL